MKTISSYAFLRGATAGALLALFASLVPLLPAQTVVATTPQLPAPPVLTGPFATFNSSLAAHRARNAPASSVLSALRSDLPLIQRGPVALRPHLQYRFVYADGIESGPGELHETTIQALTAGVLFEIGKHWKLDYTPTWTFYSNHVFHDTFDQTASLSGHVSRRDWTFAANQSYGTSHAVLAETARQSRQELIATSLDAVWRIGRRSQLDLNVSRTVRYANALTESPEWTTSDWLQYATTDWFRYQISPRLDVAAGVTFGWADVSVGDDMTFSQPQLQISWRPTKKISLGVQGGRESRKFSGPNDESISTPIYSATMTYEPFSTTKLLFSANRTVSASYFANEITKGAGWTAGLQQRLLRRFFLDTTYAESTTRYFATRALETPRRDDAFSSFSARLSTVLFRRTMFALFYEMGKNTSKETLYSFTANQYGGELSHRF